MARRLSRTTPWPLSRAFLRAAALGAGLLAVSGCYHPDPEIEAQMRLACRPSTVFGPIAYYFGSLYCDAIRPEPTIETAGPPWQDMCRTAAAGDGRARATLAWHYRNGWAPAPEDRAEAYKWFSLASDAGVAEAAQWRDELGAELDADEMAAAEARLAAWTPEAETCPAAQVQARPAQ